MYSDILSYYFLIWIYSDIRLYQKFIFVTPCAGCSCKDWIYFGYISIVHKYINIPILDVQVQPSHIRVARCAGSCQSSPGLTCYPLESKMVGGTRNWHKSLEFPKISWWQNESCLLRNLWRWWLSVQAFLQVSNFEFWKAWQSLFQVPGTPNVLNNRWKRKMIPLLFKFYIEAIQLQESFSEPIFKNQRWGKTSPALVVVTSRLKIVLLRTRYSSPINAGATSCYILEELETENIFVSDAFARTPLPDHSVNRQAE